MNDRAQGLSTAEARQRLLADGPNALPQTGGRFWLLVKETADGQAVRIAGRDVVRGDLLLLAEGDRVAADGTLLKADSRSDSARVCRPVPL